MKVGERLLAVAKDVRLLEENNQRLHSKVALLQADLEVARQKISEQAAIVRCYVEMYPEPDKVPEQGAGSRKQGGRPVAAEPQQTGSGLAPCPLPLAAEGAERRHALR